jgi:hypothetical protein
MSSVGDRHVDRSLAICTRACPEFPNAANLRRAQRIFGSENYAAGGDTITPTLNRSGVCGPVAALLVVSGATGDAAVPALCWRSRCVLVSLGGDEQLSVGCCDIAACSLSYRFFRASNCTYPMHIRRGLW